MYQNASYARAHAQRVRRFGRKVYTRQYDLANVLFNGIMLFLIAVSILTAIFIHGAAIIVAVGCAVPLIVED